MTSLEYVRAEDQLPAGGEAPGGALRLAPLVGTWYATDQEALGIVRLELHDSDGALLVRAFGADVTEPYDWGEVSGTPYGHGVTAVEAMAFSAIYDFGFLITILSAYLIQGMLVLDTFNTFTDSSGRSNYFTREFFHR
ncbi:MAG TPA: hypothetical protein VGX25_31270 [Actinophytocola sp.]|uniref:hypothetical protein n=1 Tax=Actinophytocola sp. TaxID=1872138 RepID=UPI002DDCA3B4|nr:hypothetical protein [Actinophytocola sp.]HEV2783890.1 hypothetical protein [Actinophytocola sp.]